MECYGVGVGDLVKNLIKLLYPTEKDLNQIKNSEKNNKNEDGNAIHIKFGCNGGQVFTKYYFDTKGNYSVEIRGTPDKIDIEEGYVLELKTYSNERTRKIQEEKGKLQLIFYCWLIGIYRAILILYNINNGEIEIFEYIFDKNEIEKIVSELIEKYIEFVKRNKKLQMITLCKNLS